MSDIGGPLLAGGFIGAVAPYFADSHATLFCPVTFSVHAMVQDNYYSGIKAVLAKSLIYFAKPIDRIIQAVVATVFCLIDHLSKIQDCYNEQSYGWMAFRIVISPLTIPLFTIKSILDAVGLLLNGALQLVIPYQTIYAMCVSDATEEFFELRKEIKDEKNIWLDPLPYRAFHPSNSLSSFSTQEYTVITHYSDGGATITTTSDKAEAIFRRTLIYL